MNMHNIHGMLCLYMQLQQATILGSSEGRLGHWQGGGETSTQQ